MYLSRLALNPRARQVRADMADCHSLHRTILVAFPANNGAEKAREQFGVLHRLDVDQRSNEVTLLVQSSIPADWERLPQGYVRRPPEQKPVDAAHSGIGTGSHLRFRLRANPTKRLGNSAVDTPEWIGKRVNLQREEDQLAWLGRKSEQGGFRLLEVRAAAGVLSVDVVPEGQTLGRRQGERMTFGSVLFEGALEVTQPDRFRETLAAGIGSGKAYGFGLLSVARLTR